MSAPPAAARSAAARNAAACAWFAVPRLRLTRSAPWRHAASMPAMRVSMDADSVRSKTFTMNTSAPGARSWMAAVTAVP